MSFVPELNTRALNLEDALSYNIYLDSRSEGESGIWGLLNTVVSGFELLNKSQCLPDWILEDMTGSHLD